MMMTVTKTPRSVGMLAMRLYVIGRFCVQR